MVVVVTAITHTAWLWDCDGLITALEDIGGKRPTIIFQFLTPSIAKVAARKPTTTKRVAKRAAPKAAKRARKPAAKKAARRPTKKVVKA